MRTIYVVVLTIAATAAIIVCRGLNFPLADVAFPCSYCVPLGGVAMFYQRRSAGCLMVSKALIIMVSFSAALATLTYAVATTGHSYVDQQLAAVDAAIGLSAGDVLKWTAERPLFSSIMSTIYFSIIPQTIAVIAILGLRENRRLDLFINRFVVCSLVTTLLFIFFPAQGACVHFGLPIPDYYQATLAHIDALRGCVQPVTWREAQGIVTFPSFHVIWAVLITAAFRGTKLFLPSLGLNLAVIASTITTGMHYFIDIAGALAVVGLIISLMPLDAE